MSRVHIRCHLPLQRGELNALVLLSSAADDSDKISVKAAMLALEEPKALSSRTMFDVKESQSFEHTVPNVA